MQLLPVWFIYIAAAMRIFGGMAYLRATLSGNTRPHAISWFIWSITPLISFFAELSVGVGLISILTLALALSPMAVFIAAIVKDRSLLKADLFDLTCIAIAAAGILIWALTSQPIMAIILAITADAVSALPTIRKTIRRPDSEYPPTYLLSASSMVLALLATTEISFAAFAFPTYVLIMNLVVAGLAMRRYSNKYKSPRKAKNRSRR